MVPVKRLSYLHHSVVYTLNIENNLGSLMRPNRLKLAGLAQKICTLDSFSSLVYSLFQMEIPFYRSYLILNANGYLRFASSEGCINDLVKNIMLHCIVYCPNNGKNV